MNLIIYQINQGRDKDGVCYKPYNDLPQIQGSRNVDSSIYDRVYECTSGILTVDKFFDMLTNSPPEFYRGRCPAVSDVIGIGPTGEEPDEFYYCDLNDFRKIAFSADETQPAPYDLIDVVIAEPGKLARIAKVDSSYYRLAKALGGTEYQINTLFEHDSTCVISADERWADSVLRPNRALYNTPGYINMSYSNLCCLFRNAESSSKPVHLTGYIVFTEDSFDKPYPVEARTYVVSSQNPFFQVSEPDRTLYGSALDGSHPNIRLDECMACERAGKEGWKIERCYIREEPHEITAVVYGTMVICVDDGKFLCSLSKEQLQEYVELFRYPERFTTINGRLMAVPYTPGSSCEQ